MSAALRLKHCRIQTEMAPLTGGALSVTVEKIFPSLCTISVMRLPRTGHSLDRTYANQGAELDKQECNHGIYYG